jgi:hypothetical protein
MQSFSKRWIEILEEVTQFSHQSQKVWYRGQNNNRAEKEHDYKLRSGIFRLNFDLEHILEWEYISFKRFMENGFDIHKTENEWDLLYIMQQYGLKTRLLDWTESFAVALYFATKHWDEENECSVWLLDPYRMNTEFHGQNELISMSRKSSFIHARDQFDKSLALSPYVNTTRGMSQKGFFTLQGNTIIGLEEEENHSLVSKGILKHIKLEPELKPDIAMFLELSGINHFTIFPDLTGLASFVNQWATEVIYKKVTGKELNK